MKPAKWIPREQAYLGDGEGRWHEPWVLELKEFLRRFQQEQRHRKAEEQQEQFSKTQPLPLRNKR